jgi:hypothetical protein
MTLALIGRSDRRISLLDISNLKKPVQLGDDIILPNNPISITVNTTSKGSVAYVVSEGNLSIINLNLPKGPSKKEKPINLPLGASPNGVTIKYDSSIAYALGNGGTVLFPIDLTASTPQLGNPITLPYTGSAIRFLHDNILGVTAKDVPIFMRIQFSDATTTPPKIETLTLNTGCTAFAISNTILYYTYTAGGRCLSCIQVNPITPPPAPPLPLYKISTTMFDEPITALAPSDILLEATLVAGKKIYYIKDNKILASFNLPQGSRAITSADQQDYTYSSPNTSDNFIMQIDLIGGSIVNIPMPWEGPYPCLTVFNPSTYGGIGSNRKKEKKPKKKGTPKKGSSCNQCKKCNRDYY